MVNSMKEYDLEFDIVDGQVSEYLRLKFDRQGFIEAFEFGIYGKLNVYEALKVAQFGAFAELTPWQAGCLYEGEFDSVKDFVKSKGYEVCSALEPFVDWRQAANHISPGIKVIQRYGLAKMPYLVFRKSTVDKPRIKAKTSASL